MLKALLKFDYQITQFIATFIPHNQFTNLFFSFWSLTASSLPIWFVIALLLFIFEEKVDRKFIVYLIVSLGVTSIIVFGLKHTFKRVRPTVTIASLKKCDTDFAFPSGHAAIAFAVGTVLAGFDKKRKWFYYLVAFLIGFSRIFLQCHYFFDVISGGIIGYAISQLILTFHF